MILYIVLGLLLFFIVLVPLYNLAVWKLSGNQLTNTNVLLAGHRGSSSLAPENTLQAIDSGLAQGVNFIEIDIRQTRDNQLIVMHDKSVDRTTNGSGNVGDMMYDDIRKLNASKALDGYATPTTVPTLQEVIDKICASPASLIIEIKDPQLYPGMDKRLIEILKHSGCMNRLFVFSFDSDVVFRIKKELPDITTGLFCVGIEKLKYASQVDYICPNWISLLYFPNLINDIHKRGAKSLVWTLDNSLFKQYLIDKHADGMITNNPPVLK